MQQPKYKFYATLLDGFTNYLESDAIWEKYWGWSEEPPHTQEEYKQICFQEFIDRINRVPFDSEAADRGTAFNEIIDCMILHQNSDKMKIEKVYSDMIDGKETVIALKAIYNNREFTFPISTCREFADYYKGAIPQVLVSGIVETCYGNVEVYGYIDELMPQSVHDIKTTGSYQVGKFKNHWQHIVYPYCLLQKGNEVKTFEYNILELSKAGKPNGTFTETYVFNEQRDAYKLKKHCEALIEFLNENKNLITDRKVFGGENNG